MGAWHKLIVVLGGVSVVAGCATTEPPPDELPPTEAGNDNVTDNSGPAYYSEGPWKASTSRSGYIGDDYDVIAQGVGDNYAVFNIETIQEYEVSAHWTAHSNRASNAKFVIHHINDAGELVTDTVIVNQRENHSQWVLLGVYRMSNLTGRVTLSDDANGYVVADAVRFRPLITGTADSDSDGMPDWFEVRYGLNPNDPADAELDADGDGLSNVEEYVAGNDPTVAESNVVEPLPGSSVTLSWEPPSSRENGAPLSTSEIAYYEVQYSPAIDTTPLQVDDDSEYFQIYGADISTSSHTAGYVGTGYYPLPPGNGEILAEWSVYELVPGRTYRLEANWTSESNRSTSAPFSINFVDLTGSVSEETVTVDQTQGGGTWQPITEFVPGESSMVVEAANSPEGYVIADAVRVVPISSDNARTVTVEDANQTSVSVSGLEPGSWQFRVRTVDSNGVKSRYTEPVTYQIN